VSPTKRSITIRDIAREAHVGVGTASRVLNGGKGVRQSTLARVSAVIRELGFRPNAQARRILRGRSEMVCFILSNRPFLHPLHAGILQGFEACASSLKQHVVFVAVHASEECPAAQISLPPILLEQGWTDGVILAGAIYPNLIRRIETLGIPFVAFGNNVFGPRRRRHFDQVGYDGTQAEFAAAQYLIGRGHRSVAFVGDIHYPWFQEQHRGYVRAMAASGLRPLSMTARHEAGFVEYGEWAGPQLLQRTHPPTAILAGNDEIAFGLWRSLSRKGVRIPEDVSLIGFDDREIALLVEPPLTTLRVPTNQIGHACMTLLLERLRRPNMPFTKRLLPTELVERESVRSL